MPLFVFEQGQKILELGGGDKPFFHPNIDCRQCERDGQPTVDIVWDLNQHPLPIQDNEWDGIFSMFVIEHLSWRKVRQFLAEIYRMLNRGGKTIIITANTAKQMEWVQRNEFGSDAFEKYSCILFGDNDYPENTHRNFMSPFIITDLLMEVGFSDVVVAPYGATQTDMIVEATKY